MRDQADLDRVVSELESHVSELKARLTAAEGLSKVFRTVMTTPADRPATALTILEKGKRQIADAEQTYPAQVRHLRALWTSLAAEADDRISEIVRALPAALEAADLHIDRSSRHPNYHVENQLISITIEPRKRQARIHPRNGSPLRTPLDVPAVVDAVIEQFARLTQREFDEDHFFQELVEAIHSQSEGRRSVPLRAIAAQMPRPGSQKGYPLDEFAVDLGRLLRSPSLSDRKPHLKVNHTRDERQGLHLYGLESGGLVGTIEIDGGTR